jgi:biotin transport system ATP-binding protein
VTHRRSGAGVLAAEGLGHRFPDGVWGLEDVSLAFGPGEFTVLAGPNGAGKTLFMRHLVGLVPPTTGRVTLDGVPIGDHLSEVRRRVGLVFQDSGAQIVGLTVGEEVAFGPRNRGWTRNETEAAVAEALGAVGLEGRREEVCAHLSGGEKRRLAIAGVLACDPQILVLDEPFTGLDLPAVQAVLTTLLGLHARGKTILLLTHELDKCLAHAQRLVLMAGRRVIADGTPAEVWDRIPEARTHRPAGGPGRIAEMTWLG